MYMTFDEWIDTFLEEKGIDLEDTFEVQGESGTNFMSYGIIVEHMKIAPEHEQTGIKDMLSRIDYFNASVTDYMEHLAQAIAK
jgi:hypothetical protein